MHPREYRAGNPKICYRCGKEGHYAKKFPNPPNYGNVAPQTKNPTPKKYAMQVTLEGPSISQGRLEAPEAEARVYTYTKEDVEAGTSNVVTGQLSVANMSSYIIFDYGATHSFVFTKHATRLDRRYYTTDL